MTDRSKPPEDLEDTLAYEWAHQDETEARGYARCQADVLALGKHDAYCLRDFLLAISLSEHVGAAERAKGERE